MAASKMDFLKSPEQNLRTWGKICRVLLVSAGVTLLVVGLLGLFFAT